MADPKQMQQASINSAMLASMSKHSGDDVNHHPSHSVGSGGEGDTGMGIHQKAGGDLAPGFCKASLDFVNREGLPFGPKDGVLSHNMIPELNSLAPVSGLEQAASQVAKGMGAMEQFDAGQGFGVPGHANIKREAGLITPSQSH